MRFLTKQRIKRQQDFRRALKGQHYRYDGLIVNRIESPRCDSEPLNSKVTAPSRLGIIVSKKVIRKAHQRNRQKRLIREAFRLRQHDIPKGEDWVFVITCFSNENTLRDHIQQFWDCLDTL